MKLRNTMTGQVDELQPVASSVKLYTCGITVYSQPHIGNWIGYIYWDALVRVLRAEGHIVERTQNITDVGHLVSDDDSGEDKMEKGARAEGKTAWDVADHYITVADHEAYGLLKLIRPDHLVRATDYIAEQIEFAKTLEEKGYTYMIPGEGLYFDTSKLSDYGKLAHLQAAGLEAGKRVAVGGKRLVTDFAIWKLSPTNATRDMEWESPWGTGFPGWHLECSVIARETLGDQIDIHTGGIDHIPVHHTNEIAQTESVTDKPFSKLWVHNNHLKIDGTKISKSLGNIVTLTDIIERGYDLNAFKLFALSKHYRTEGNFDWEIMQAAQNRFNNWRDVATLRHQVSGADSENSQLTNGLTAIKESLLNDLDTPNALACIDEIFSDIESKSLDTVSATSLTHFLTTINDLIGIDVLSSTPNIPDDMYSLVVERQRAREAKDWTRSDELRQRILEQGIAIRDTSSGPIWTYA